LTYVSALKAYLFIHSFIHYGKYKCLMNVDFLGDRGGSFPGDFDLLGRRRLNRRNRVCRGDMAISDFCVPAAEEDGSDGSGTSSSATEEAGSGRRWFLVFSEGYKSGLAHLFPQFAEFWVETTPGKSPSSFDI
jgi:hypothetical protein